MARIYEFLYKGKIKKYHKEEFKELEKRFKEAGKNIFRIFCSKVYVKNYKSEN